jgi:hypothetical protein
MNSTWLSRKIKGPNAEGDPVKKKNGKGVKPYVTYDRDDPRIQAYSDSLDAHLLTNYFEKEFKANRGYNLYNTFRTKSANIVPANTPSLTTSKSWPYDYYASQTKMKPSRIISSNNKTEREFPLYDKPKQKVMLQSLEKMPIGKLKSKSTTPKKLSSRKPENFVYYDKPRKTSLAITHSPGSKAAYATVNRRDKKGTIYLTKKEYDKEMKNTFIKIN